MTAKLLSLAVAVLAAVSHVAQGSLIQPFGQCAELNNYYINSLSPLISPYGVSTGRAFTRSRTPAFMPDDPGTFGGPAGLNSGQNTGHPQRVGFSNISSEDVPASEARDNGQVAGVDFSTTNNQVEGVDEPDIIKTDGKRVFTLTNSLFSVVEVLEGGKTGQRTGSLRLPTFAFEMLYQGNWVLAIGTDYRYKRPVEQRYQTDPSRGEVSTVVYQINVADVSNPYVVQTLRLEGSYVESREVDGVARIIVSYNPLNSVWMFRANNNYPGYLTEKWNREIVQNSKAGNWMPTYTLEKDGEVQSGVYTSCATTYRSTTTFAGFKVLSVVTLPIDGFISPKSAASVLSDADDIYSTTESLYVTTSLFQYTSDTNRRAGGDYTTSFHRFNVTNDGTKFLGSGSVSGSVLNQFSMHESNGIFYIATTDGAAWWSTRDLSKSKVTSFEYNPHSRQLVQIGEVDNLGLGERIFAVRYLDDTAYVVTFRQIDPLYVIDLADAKNLRVTGELKIPGFSSYLHYVGKGRILGVGQEATLDGRTTGAKVSLFDVSDKTNPQEVASWSLKGSFSNAQWDHRAFLYWWREGIAVMPVAVFSQNERFNGAVILNVADDQITERGRVTQKIAGNNFEESIRRNTIVGRTNLWSMSYSILQVNDVKSLAETGQVRIDNQ